MSELHALVGQHYAYASGRTGVLQQVLLSSADRDRLLGAKDITDAEHILTEIRFTDRIDQGLSKADAILDAVGQWIHEEVVQMTPESKRAVFSILWLDEDAAIISYLLKQHHNLTSDALDAPSSGMSAFDTTELRELIDGETTPNLPDDVVTFVKEQMHQKDATAKSIDNAVAVFISNKKRELAKKSGSAHIKQFVAHGIDLLNIDAALREADEHSDQVFLEGGSLNQEKLRGKLDDIVSAVTRSSLPFSLAEAVRNSDDDPNRLEQAFSEILAEDIARMWNVPLSIEPVFAFAALAQSQLKLIRAIAIGKRAGLSPQQIKSMLPPFLSTAHYVLSS